MKQRTLFPWELIGKEIEVVKASNKSNLGMKGKVVDETKFTLKIKIEGETKTLLKKNIIFKVEPTGQLVEGKDIVKRPEERLK
ncbi:MAG: ribonuclease P protein subunit [Nanoarchaeota archaeon]|nr:ribonuclease P protein subunit [Nanoarchaeota archaeon]MBU1622639.1 ribonuclease P protein subunit [Nanoarchaeota archaeon]MBU1974275.1 ribonuclease P protein subunit [Nanoarchaeota archaeon]